MNAREGLVLLVKQSVSLPAPSTHAPLIMFPLVQTMSKVAPIEPPTPITRVL